MKHIKTILLYLIIFFGTPFFAKADTIDNYQFYKNRKLILNDSGFGSARTITNLLFVSKDDTRDVWMINFNHCTAGANNRKIKLTDKSGKLVFSWSFPDKGIQRLMDISINDLWTLIKDSSKEEFHLYYYDTQLPNGTFLTSVQLKTK